MADQRHTPYDEAPMDTPRAGEPVAAYQPAAQRPVITEMSKTLTKEEEWLRPMTMDDIHRRIDEAEAGIMAGRVVDSQQVFDGMERKYPWLCE